MYCLSYKKLFKKLIDLDMQHNELMKKANVSRSTFYKLKNEYDVTYKKHNVEELNKNNKITRVIVATIFIINLITILYVSMK